MGRGGGGSGGVQSGVGVGVARFGLVGRCWVWGM